MFVRDLKQEFYSRLAGKRILIIVNYDIDAICASKILQALFKYDAVLYSVVPIMGLKGLQRAYQEHKDDVKFVLLLNCGGCVDIVDLLQPEDDIIFFICDAHRPLDVCNIYSDQQVCILSDLSQEDNIPAFETIFWESDSEADDSDNDDNDNDNDGSEKSRANDNQDTVDSDGGTSSSPPPAKKLSRMERHEQRVIKQRKRRAWENERDRVMFEYTQFGYYGRSSALIFFELAWKLTKDNVDLLWWAIVGITEQLLLGKIERGTYALEVDNIQSHVSRLTNKSNDLNNTSSSKIVFENDLHLVLYRHWSIVESMKYSMYCSCRLRLWTLRGEKRLAEFLVEMGLPLVQARQLFASMDLVLRQEFYSMVEKLAEKYDIPDIVYGSFTLNYGYRNRYAAADYVYALLAILESSRKDKLPEDCFLSAQDSLSRSHKDQLIGAIDASKLLLTAIFRQVQSSLEAHQIQSTGSFLYFILSEENVYFSCPYGLIQLAKFILNAYVVTSRKRQAPEMPLIASCPIDAERGLSILVGIPPIREDSPKNFFGKAFEQAATRSGIAILQDSFETSLIQLRQRDLNRFLDALTVLLS